MAQLPEHTVVEHDLQLTPFVGRERELADLTQLLSAPACHLLTLTGPGGIGKTRLALEVASRRQDLFEHGVCHVPLQSVVSPEFLTSAIADALGAALSRHDDPQAQLLNYLRGKRLLLLLDNLEQLLPGAALLTDILQVAPRVKLLVTSREILNLRGEWVYPVAGLAYPQHANEPNIDRYSAVQLFVERAVRARPDFDLERERRAVAHICQLLEGMPLAIELAAPWVKAMRCSDIATEIQRSLDFLTTRWRDVPERHRSINAVFNHSWELLSDEKQYVFKRLAVFRGGFTRHAAEAVAGASIHILSALVDKSLLHWSIDSRYQIHELLRQYAEEQLSDSPEEVVALCNAHCTYYTDFLGQRLDSMLGGRQREATAEIAVELENIRRAWAWAVERGKATELYRASESLASFYQFQSRFLEGAAAFKKAAKALAPTPDHPTTTDEPPGQVDLARVSILNCLGWFYIRLGRLDEAEAVLAECQALYERLNIPPIPGIASDPLLALSIIANIKGDYRLARERANQAFPANEAINHLLNRQTAHYALAQALLGQGEYEAARQQIQLAYALSEQAQDRWFMAYCLNTLGDTAVALNELAAAKRYYETSYAIRKEFNDPEGMALALSHLGEIALQQGAYAEARRLYDESVGIYREINDRGGLARALSGLGHTALARGDHQEARRQFRAALQIAAEVQYTPLILSLLLGIGELLLHSGQHRLAFELLRFVREDPAGGRQLQARAEVYLRNHRHYEAAVKPEPPATAGRLEQAPDLERAVAAAQGGLAGAEGADVAQPTAADQPSQPPAEPLVEPLTPRELEVLQLIADGMSNREIAGELVIAVGTVKRHTAEIYGKLAVHSRTQAVARARGLQLLP